MTASDTGPFAIVPVWVLDLPISHLALRLYAIHADYADRNSGRHFHSRKALAERLGCSVDAIDRANAKLVEHKALELQHRGQPGRRASSSNVYVVVRARPGGAAQMRLPSRVDAAPPGRVDAAPVVTNQNQIEPERVREAMTATKAALAAAVPATAPIARKAAP